MKKEKPLVVLEMTLRNLNDHGRINYQDFLDRVDLLGTLGYPVLISNYDTHYRLASFFFRHTQKPIGIVMGIPTLREIFDEKYYSKLDGGILEAFGRLFKNDLRLYVYPFLEKESSEKITLENLKVPKKLSHLYAFLMQNRNIVDIEKYNENYLKIFSRDVLGRIRKSETGWEKNLPPKVAQKIKRNKLFGYKPEK